MHCLTSSATKYNSEEQLSVLVLTALKQGEETKQRTIGSQVFFTTEDVFLPYYAYCIEEAFYFYSLVITVLSYGRHPASTIYCDLVFILWSMGFGETFLNVLWRPWVENCFVSNCPLLRTVFQTAVPHEWNCCCCPHMNQYYNNDCNHKSQYFQLLDKDWKYWMSYPNRLSLYSVQWHRRRWLCKLHKCNLNI